MSEYIHLLGADDVAAAGRRMEEAAQQMSRAADSLDEEAQRAIDWHTAKVRVVATPRLSYSEAVEIHRILGAALEGGK